MVAVQTIGLVVEVGDGDDFVGAGFSDQFFEAVAHGFIGADDGYAEAGVDGFAFEWAPGLVVGGWAVHGLDGWDYFYGLVADEAQETLQRRGGQVRGLRVGFGGDDGRGDDEMRFCEDAGFEGGAVDAGCFVESLRGEMRGEGEGQAEAGGELGSVEAGAEDGDGDPGVLAGDGAGHLAGTHGAQETLKFGEELREVVAVLFQVAAKRAHGGPVATRGAAEAEVDAVGIDRRQGAELLGDDERGVVGEHDAAGADADGFGRVGDVSDEDGGSGGGDAGDGVMLGEPDAAVSPLLDILREIDGAGYGLGHGGFGGIACAEGNEVENGDWEAIMRSSTHVG